MAELTGLGIHFCLFESIRVFPELFDLCCRPFAIEFVPPSGLEFELIGCSQAAGLSVDFLGPFARFPASIQSVL